MAVACPAPGAANRRPTRPPPGAVRISRAGRRASGGRADRRAGRAALSQDRPRGTNEPRDQGLPTRRPDVLYVTSLTVTRRLRPCSLTRPVRRPARLAGVGEL